MKNAPNSGLGIVRRPDSARFANRAPENRGVGLGSSQPGSEFDFGRQSASAQGA
jgi:hypothetical protein